TASGTNTATATLSTPAPPATPDSFSFTAPFNFATATPTEVDNTAGRDDTFDAALPTTVSGSGEIIYNQDQTCGSSHTAVNTAVVTATDSHTQSSDAAQVVITCYGLTTMKDAHPSFGRTFDWTVKKYVSLDGVTYQ